MYCEKHDEVDYWACPHCLDDANAKVESLTTTQKFFAECLGMRKADPIRHEGQGISLELTDEERGFFKVGTSKHNHGCRQVQFTTLGHAQEGEREVLNFEGAIMDNKTNPVVNDCFVAIFCDMILKLQAGKRRAEFWSDHNRQACKVDDPRHKWKGEQWMDEAQADLIGQGKG